MQTAFLKGFATSAALIVAIGAQSTFVLRCGLRREHVLVCALFLVYGALAARRALHRESLTARDEAQLTLSAAIAECLAFTYLTPHCWLDTVVLLGAIASPLPAPQRAWFGIGATSASFAWFFALGFGARLLRGVFARPLAWKILDAAIALVMWAIALSLIL